MWQCDNLLVLEKSLEMCCLNFTWNLNPKVYFFKIVVCLKLVQYSLGCLTHYSFCCHEQRWIASQGKVAWIPRNWKWVLKIIVMNFSCCFGHVKAIIDWIL